MKSVSYQKASLLTQSVWSQLELKFCTVVVEILPVWALNQRLVAILYNEGKGVFVFTKQGQVMRRTRVTPRPQSYSAGTEYAGACQFERNHIHIERDKLLSVQVPVQVYMMTEAERDAGEVSDLFSVA